jgi:hypothetical protein
VVVDVCGFHGGKSLRFGWRERLAANVPPADSTVKSGRSSFRRDHTTRRREDAVTAGSRAM